VLAGCDDSIARIWLSQNGQLLRTFRGHALAVTLAIFSSDDRLVASVSDDDTVAIWNVSEERCMQMLQHQSDVTQVLFIADNAKVITLSSDPPNAKIWNSTTGEDLQTIPNVTAVVGSTDGTLILTAGIDRTSRIWSSTTGECQQTLVHEIYVACANFSTDGALVATSTFDRHVNVQMWSSTSGECLQTLPESDQIMTWIAFSAEDTLLVTATTWFVKIWSRSTLECIQTIDVENLVDLKFCF